MEHRREICFLRIRPLVGPAPPSVLGGLRGLHPLIRSPDSQMSCGFLAVLSRKQAETRRQSPQGNSGASRRQFAHVVYSLSRLNRGWILGGLPPAHSLWVPSAQLLSVQAAPAVEGGWASGLGRWDVGPRAAGGGLDLSLCTSRSEEAGGRLLSPGTICPEDMTGKKLLEAEVSVGGGRMGRQVFQGEADLGVGVEAGRPGPEDGTWRHRRARPWGPPYASDEA